MMIGLFLEKFMIYIFSCMDNVVELKGVIKQDRFQCLSEQNIRVVN